MKQSKICLNSYIRTFLSSVIFAMFLWQASPVQAEQHIDNNYGNKVLGNLDLQINEGTVNGSFVNQPLGMILNAINQQNLFEYQGQNDFLDYQVSGNFKDILLIEAIYKLLRSFNYSLTMSDGNQRIKHLHIIGSKHESTIQNKIIETPEELFSNPASPPELSEQDLLFLERSNPDTAQSNDSIDEYIPTQEPGSEVTGPQRSSDNIDEELPGYP